MKTAITLIDMMGNKMAKTEITSKAIDSYDFRLAIADEMPDVWPCDADTGRAEGKGGL